MSTKWKMLATGVATIAALSTGTALYAQAGKAQAGAGMMMHESGDMKSMMDMMGQMNQMMESCNKMMQNMNSSKGTDRPTGKSAPHTSQ